MTSVALFVGYTAITLLTLIGFAELAGYILWTPARRLHKAWKVSKDHKDWEKFESFAKFHNARETERDG